MMNAPDVMAPFGGLRDELAELKAELQSVDGFPHSQRLLQVGKFVVSSSIGCYVMAPLSLHRSKEIERITKERDENPPDTRAVKLYEKLYIQPKLESAPKVSSLRCYPKVPFCLIL